MPDGRYAGKTTVHDAGFAQRAPSAACKPGVHASAGCRIEFKTEEERWAYWARHILMNRYGMPATDIYRLLFEVVKGKDYFLITTDVDGQFEKSGFGSKRVFAVQGDYAYPQCATTSSTAMKAL